MVERVDFKAEWLPRRVLALAVVVLAAYLLYDYPAFRTLLAVYLLVYVGLMFRWPHVWLAVLPASVPLLQLAHWSGRLYIEDIDILFLVTLAILLWRRHDKTMHRESVLPWMIHLAIFFLFVSYLASLVVALLPWPDWDATDLLASFLSPANSLRLAKSFFWAALLSPFVFQAFRQDHIESRRMILSGMLVGGLATGFVALWERGVWQSLFYGRDIYQILSPLLDFSTPYRITGTFAEMHTGGEAIDGYLGLAWPIMVLALVVARRQWALAMSGLALGLVFYSLVTTFSRGLYLSLVVAGGVWLAGAIYVFHRNHQSLSARHFGRLALLLVASMFLMGFAFVRGGMMTLASALLIFMAATWVSWKHWPRGLSWALLAAILAFCVVGAIRGMVTSKWHPLEFATATPIAAFLIGATVFAGLIGGRLLPRGVGLKPYFVLGLIVVAAAGTLIPALLGYRMTERLSNVMSDFSTRTGHWNHVLALKNDGIVDRVFGMGLGSFPKEYHWDNVNRPEGSGNFSLIEEHGNVFLRTTGGKDLRLGQRLSLDTAQPIQLRLRVRSPSPEAWLKIRLCRRFVIHPTEWNSQCVSINHTVMDTKGQWNNLVFELDPSSIRDGLIFGRAPLMFEINNRREYSLMSHLPAIVDIDDISLTGIGGTAYLANGDFERGTDRWLPYYDFNHLPWHVKNLWLHLYFEQGVLGLFAFLAAWLAAIGVGVRAMSRGEIFPVGLAASLTGFVAVGMFGSPIDAPRVAWLYYFLMFTLIAQYHAARGGGRRGSDLKPASASIQPTKI